MGIVDGTNYSVHIIVRISFFGKDIVNLESIQVEYMLNILTWQLTRAAQTCKIYIVTWHLTIGSKLGHIFLIPGWVGCQVFILCSTEVVNTGIVQ